MVFWKNNNSNQSQSIRITGAQYTNYVQCRDMECYSDTLRRLRVFEMDCLRRIAEIARRDHRWNTDIKATLHIQDDVVQKLAIRHLRYFGWMDPQWLLCISLHGRVDGQRCRRCPRKTWLDFIEDNCNNRGLSLVESFRASGDQCKWRSMLRLSRHTTVLSRHWRTRCLFSRTNCNEVQLHSTNFSSHWYAINLCRTRPQCT